MDPKLVNYTIVNVGYVCSLLNDKYIPTRFTLLTWLGGELGAQVNGLTLQNDLKTSDLLTRFIRKNTFLQIFGTFLVLERFTCSETQGRMSGFKF